MTPRYIMRVRKARYQQLFSARSSTWAIVLVAVSMLVLACFRWSPTPPRVENSVETVPDQRQSSRPVYPYSVVPGGVRNTSELQSAVMRDPVVAKHYEGFDLGSATLIHLPAEKLAYVSYRVGNRVYWSNRQVRLARDEQVLTDGSHLIRVRCGNRISFERQPGTRSIAEPTEAEMDLLADNFSDSTTFLPGNVDRVIRLPATLDGKPTGIPTTPSGPSPRSAPTSDRAFPGNGTLGLVIAAALATPTTGSNPAAALANAATTSQAGLPLLLGGQFLPLPAPGAFGPQGETPPNLSIGLQTFPSLPAWTGTAVTSSPVKTTPGLLTSPEFPVTILFNSSYALAPGLRFDEFAKVGPPVDQTPVPTAPEPGTYLLTGAGLLLLTGTIRKALVRYAEHNTRVDRGSGTGSK
jgi:hypothetical protein